MSEISRNNALGRYIGSQGGNCPGCRKGSGSSFSDKVTNVAKGVASFVKYATSNDRVSDAVFRQRKTACENCQHKDSAGERLFRVGIFKKRTCGKFFMQQPARDPKVDGCGCLLEAKWAVPDEECPLGVWGKAEKEDLTVRPRDKENLPEGFSLVEGIPNMGIEYSVPLTLTDGRRILVGVQKIEQVYEAKSVVGANAASCVEAYQRVFLVKENAEDIRTAIAAWEEPPPVAEITYADLQPQAEAKGLNVVYFKWPFARFGLLKSSYKRAVQTNMRFVRNVPEFLDQVKARLETFRGRPSLTKGALRAWATR